MDTKNKSNNPFLYLWPPFFAFLQRYLAKFLILKNKKSLRGSSIKLKYSSKSMPWSPKA